MTKLQAAYLALIAGLAILGAFYIVTSSAPQPEQRFGGQVSVPSAASAGYFLISTSSGNWIATTSDPIHAGSFYATSTKASRFPYASTTGLTADNIFYGAAGILTLPNLFTQPAAQNSTAFLNNVLFGEDGYSFVASTTAGTSFSLSAAQFCNLTSISVPVANTTTVSVTFPADAAVSAVCGTLVPGQWGWEWVVNQSSFPITLATTAGSNINFKFATGTPSAFNQYPPQIPASTTAQGFPIQINSTNVDFNFILFAPLNSPLSSSSGGSGAAYSFTPSTNFGATTNATTGIVWFQNGLQASSTLEFVTLDQADSTATSTLLGNIQLGSGVRSNKFAITADKTYLISQSVGGLINVDNTLNDATALTIWTNHASGKTTPELRVRSEDTRYDQQLIDFNSQSQTRTTLGVGCVNTVQGCVKFSHSGNGSDTGVAGLSMDLIGTSTQSDAMGIFITSTATGTTGALLNLKNIVNTTDAAASQLLILTAAGKFGLATATPAATLAVQGNQFIAGNITSTSTTASIFPFASTTAFTATTICLTGDTCRTSWPTSGSSGIGDPFTHTSYAGQVTSATTSTLWLTNSTVSLAASSSILTYASSTAISASSEIGITSGSGVNFDGGASTAIAGVGLQYGSVTKSWVTGNSVNLLMRTGSANQGIAFIGTSGNSIAEFKNDQTTFFRSSMAISTTTRYAQFTVSSTTAPQVSILSGSNTNPWVFRALADGSIHFATSTQTGATSTNDIFSVDTTSVLSASALKAANLTSGNCVQASTGGLLTTAAAACGTGGFAFPWTPTTWAAINVNSTSTTIWDKAAIGFIASSSIIDYASSTYASFISASSTKYFGAGLDAGCNGTSFLQITSGTFGCGTPSGNAGFTFSTIFGIANTAATTSQMQVTGGFAASSTVRFGNAGVASQFVWDSVNGIMGIASTTPTMGLSLGTTGIVYASIAVTENPIATSTAMLVDWSTGNTHLLQVGTAAYSIAFDKASTTGMTQKIITCNPGSTAGALTWKAPVEWQAGVAPTQTTTAGACDVYSCLITQATSTTASRQKIFCGQSPGFL